MPLPLRMSYNEEITTISLTRPCERSEAIQYHLLVIANAVKQSRFASNWIATLTLAMTNYSSTECGDCFTAGNLLKLSANTISQWGICSNCLRRPFHSWEFAQTVCGHHFTVGNSAKLSYFHPKIIFYSLIKKENDKHNKT